MKRSQSSLIVDPFFYVDHNGSSGFPKDEAIRSDAARGIATALLLDANVCLRLKNYAKGEKDNLRKEVTRLFLLQSKWAKVDVVPLLGCMELAATRHNDTLNPDKLLGIAAAAYSALMQSEYDLLHERPVLMKDISEFDLDPNPQLVFYQMLRYFYCCVLKISDLRLSSKKNLKDKAVKNVIKFQDWCESMECHVGLITQAAMEVLGGAGGSSTLLNFKAGKTPLDAAWGAAWDLWYCWMTQHYLRAVPVEEHAQHIIFVTEDASAAHVAGKCLPQALFLDRGTPSLSASSVTVDAPYLCGKEEQLLEALDERRFATIKRVVRQFADPSKKYAFNPDRIEETIAQLEDAIRSKFRSISY